MSALMFAVHLAPQISIPIAAAAGTWLIWYWLKLGDADVPKRRRRIRRVSLTLMLLALPVFVLALSYFEPKTQPAWYLGMWCVAIVLTGMVFVSAGLDVLATMRIEQERCEEEIQTMGRELVEQAQRKKAAEQGGIAEADEGEGA